MPYEVYIPEDGEVIAVINMKGPRIQRIKYIEKTISQATRLIRGGVSLVRGSGERLAKRLSELVK
ncbi:MAG: hypothetical protein ABIG37_03600 [Nanoarchaeota archaeon]|nr:hypothetical protein [Nanoarchaeota archaeon]